VFARSLPRHHQENSLHATRTRQCRRCASEDGITSRLHYDNDQSANRWERLRTEGPGAISFWYRESPRYFETLEDISFNPRPGCSPAMTLIYLDMADNCIGLRGGRHNAKNLRHRRKPHLIGPYRFARRVWTWPSSHRLHPAPSASRLRYTPCLGRVRISSSGIANSHRGSIVPRKIYLL